jgi:hypothetical protein
MYHLLKQVRSFTAIFLLSFVSVTLFSGCKELQKAVSQTQALSNCQYKIANVSNITLAGVPFQNVKGLKDISLMNAAALGSAYINKNMPLNFNLNVAIKNPGAQEAAFSGMDWVLLIDGAEYLNGVVNQRISIAPSGGTASLPMSINLNLLKVLSGKSKDNIINFASALSGADGTSSRITMKIKPSFAIAGSVYKWPSFFTINKDFKAGK